MKGTLRILLGVLLFAFSFGSLAQNISTFIPAKAPPLLPLVYKEAERLAPTLPSMSYFPALIEHESCISLTHSRCWSSISELRTAREQGLGLGQLTRAFNADGSVRFDALTDMRRRYASELSEMSWNNLRNRPDLQIRTIVLMVRESYIRLAGVKYPNERLAMTDAAYNGGAGGVLKERTACGLAAGCDPNYWFGNVELFCMKSRKPLYGGRSACDINRHHVADVWKRQPKYEKNYQLYKKAS